jgi:uncharacterized membrane protein YfcA
LQIDMTAWPEALPFVVALVATGLLSGTAAGLLGIGGGAIVVPALSNVLLWLGFAPDVVMHVAVGTSLAIIVPTSLMSARAHHRRGVMDFAVLRLWVPFIVVGTLAGGLMAGFYSGDVLRIVFAGMAFLIAANILLGLQGRYMGHLQGSAATHRTAAFIVGYVSALMGVGGGALSVPTQVAFGTPMHKAVATSAALGIGIAIAGTIGFVISGWTAEARPPGSFGYVNLPALVLVGLPAMLTAPFGAALAHRLSQVALKRVFAIFMIAMGINMLWKVFG